MTVKVVTKTSLLPAAKRRQRLFISKEHLAKVRLAITCKPLELLWQRFLREITARVGTTSPLLPTNNADTPQEIAEYKVIFRDCLNDLLNSSFAYLVTGKGDFAVLARQRINTILSWHTWVHPAHYPKTIDLTTSDISRTLAIACQWLGIGLPSAERGIISDVVQSRVIEQYVAGMMEETGWWAHECTTNWCAVVNGGIGSALLYFLDDNAVLAGILNEIIERLSIYLKGFEPDGGWIEGMQYWSYGITWYLFFADAIANATQGKVDPANIPQMKNAALFPLYSFLPPEGMINFCDAQAKAGFPVAVPLLKLAHEINTPSIRWLASQILAVSNDSPTPYVFIWSALGGNEEPPSKIPAARLFRKIEWASLRSSWDDNAVIFAAKGGYADPYEHTHLDAGTFLLNAFGRPLITELGRGEYSRGYFSPKRWENTYANTLGHNSYIVAGASQLPGRDHCGVITNSRKIKKNYYARLDISACYPKEGVESIVRHFLLLDAYGCVILDEVVCPDGTHIESRIHFAGTGNVIPPDAFLLHNGDACLSARIASNVPYTLSVHAHAEPDALPLSTEDIPLEYFSMKFSATGNKAYLAAFLHPYKREKQAPDIAVSLLPSKYGISISVTLYSHTRTLLWAAKNGKNVLDSIS